MNKLLNQILLNELRFSEFKMQPEWHDFKLEVAMDRNGDLYFKKIENGAIYTKRGEDFHCFTCNGKIYVVMREHKGGEFGNRYEKVPFCQNCENVLDYAGVFSDKNKRSSGNFIN
ncbi:MAG: hypothetical protein AABX28_03715 [Nanoarchaeota archaeon]